MYNVDAENPWVGAVDRARRQVPGLALALGAGAWCAAVVFVVRVAAGPLTQLAAGAGSAPWRYDLETALVDLALCAPLLLAAMLGGRIEARAVWRGGTRPGLAIPLGLLLGVGGFALSLAVAFAAGAVSRGSAPPPGAGQIGPIVVDAALVLLVASTEEVYFRGWIQPVLAARWGPWLGLLAASALFCAMHLFAGLRSPLAVVNIFLAGLLFGLLALRTGGLVASCATHFAWNWSETGLFGTDPNPGASPLGALFDLDLRGAPMWSGGDDTMNGSLATTLVLGLLIAGLIWGARPRPATRA